MVKKTLWGRNFKSVVLHSFPFFSILFFFHFYLYACLIQRQLSDIFLTVKLLLDFFKCVYFQEPGFPPFQQQVLSLALGYCRLSIHYNRLIEFISLGITVFVVSSVCLTSRTLDRETEAAFLAFCPQAGNEGGNPPSFQCLSVTNINLGSTLLCSSKIH